MALRINQRIGNDLAFVVLVGAAYLTLLGTPLDTLTPLGTVALFALGLVYIGIGTAGFAWAERAGRRRAALAYFAAQLPLGFLIAYLGGEEGLLVLVLFPLVSQAVRLLPWPGVLALGAIIVATLTIPFVREEGWPNTGRIAVLLIGVLTFFVVIAQVAVEEQRARAEAERARAEGERLAAELDAANGRLRAYAARVEEFATLQERNRLAREIHDGIGHYLTTINMQIQAGRALLDGDRARASALLDGAQGSTREALAEVRRAVAVLRAGPDDARSLPARLSTLVEEARAGGLHTELTVRGDARPLAPAVDLTLFRAAQEGLTNVRKHAQATRAIVGIDYGDPACVRLTVRDDGVGATRADGGFGLLGLRERAGLLGGAVALESTADDGTALSVVIPR